MSTNTDSSGNILYGKDCPLAHSLKFLHQIEKSESATSASASDLKRIQSCHPHAHCPRDTSSACGEVALIPMAKLKNWEPNYSYCPARSRWIQGVNPPQANGLYKSSPSAPSIGASHLLSTPNWRASYSSLFCCSSLIIFNAFI